MRTHVVTVLDGAVEGAGAGLDPARAEGRVPQQRISEMNDRVRFILAAWRMPRSGAAAAAASADMRQTHALVLSACVCEVRAGKIMVPTRRRHRAEGSPHLTRM